MWETFFSSLVGIYMAIFGTLFGGSVDMPVGEVPDESETPAIVEDAKTHTDTGAGSAQKPAYTQTSYYAESAYTPLGSDTDKLDASITEGRAPLAVQFTGKVSSPGYSIEWGDGQKSGTTNCRHLTCPLSPLSTSIKTSHIYTEPGTYTAKLRRHYRTNEPDCAGNNCNIVATVTIHVLESGSVCLGYKEGNLHEFKNGEKTSTIPGGHFEAGGFFLCNDGAWEDHPNG